MSEEERGGQQQRYCPSCGTETRSGNAFCDSCGASLAPRNAGLEQAGSPSSGQTPSMNDAVKEKLQGVGRWFRRPPAPSGNDLPSAAHNLLRWFKDLPIILKAAIVLVGTLLLLILLSPLGLIVALLLFGIGLIGLVVRLAQRRSVKGWGIVAVASLMLAFAFAGTSNALYGVYTSASATTSGSDATGGENAMDKEDNNGKGSAKNRSKAGKVVEKGSTKGADIDPKLKKIVDDWRSSGTESPLLLPTRLPFPVSEVSPGPLGSHLIWSEGRYQRPFANHVQINLYPAPFPSSALDLDSITIDDRSHPYTEDHSFISGGQKRERGQYDVMLWVKSERGKEYVYIVVLNTMADPLPYEEFVEMVASMKRIDPSEKTSPPKEGSSSRKR